MFDRSSGHIGICLLVLVSGVYLPASYGYAIARALRLTDLALAPIWLGLLAVFVCLAGLSGISSAVLLWSRSATGRRLGFLFVLSWALAETVAIWGWLAGPRIALAVVLDPMAPVVRLWIASSIGLYLWGWAEGYVDRSPRPDPA